MKESKFIPLYETIYQRYKQGAGFLEGDLVKLVKDYQSTDDYKGLNQTLQGRVNDAAASGFNLRVGKLHTPNAQYGSLGRIQLPATHADLYQELSPGNFGNLVTVPIGILTPVDTVPNLPPVAGKNKRKIKAYVEPVEASTLKPNEDPQTDEQTKVGRKQNKQGNTKLATGDIQNKPGANKYDDTKPSSKWKPLPKNKKKQRLSEAMENIEGIYMNMLTESEEDVGAGATPSSVAMQNVDEDFEVDVKGCARCGQDHEKLVFAKLEKPSAENTHWALCPQKGEPVLMKFDDEHAAGADDDIPGIGDGINDTVTQDKTRGFDRTLDEAKKDKKKKIDEDLDDQPANPVNPVPEDRAQTGALEEEKSNARWKPLGSKASDSHRDSLKPKAFVPNKNGFVGSGPNS